MATSKAHRAAPERLLNDYVASIKHLQGPPETHPDHAFIENDFVSSGISYTYNSSGYANRNIGFDFQVNNITYKKFFISEHGWIVLQHPDDATFARSDVSTSIADGSQILSQFVGYEHVLIAPWFDGSYQIPKNPEPLYQSGSPYEVTMFTNTTPEDIKLGKDPRNWPYDQVDRGVRYKNFYDSRKGKHLIVRWTNSPANYGVKLKFEVALYENGRIEFRYWPLGYYEPGDYTAAASTATVGIFWNGTTGATANRFRDFAPLLSYQREQRNISKLGGASYDASYLDSTTAWSIGLDQTNWPKNGAVITFSPPQNSVKFLPRKLTTLISSNKKIIEPAGLFDDRKTIGFRNNTQIHLPSGMPTRLLGDSGDVNVSLRQLLFTSGSIEVTGNVRSSIIDSQLEQLNAFENSNSYDLSFNESKIVTPTLTSSFYSTGSALENFGDGFTAPLKSKTQIRFSLPVTNATMMPSLTSSFYYYDSDKKAWSMVDPFGYRNPETSYSEFNNQGYADKYGIINAPIYRITETSRGFDAVGRKVVSGSNAVDYSLYFIGIPPYKPTYQTDNAIGTLYNGPNSPISYESYHHKISKEVITREYNNSITDNATFFPKKSQMFSFPVNQPFLIEKIIVDIPLYISGAWFKDLTTCTRAYGYHTGSTPPGPTDPSAIGKFFGPIDFGGPGLTFSMVCPRKGLNVSYLDIIASGTITHIDDAISDVVLKKDPGMESHSLRPIGFKSFSNPTCIISGSNNIFEGIVRLELEASVAGGLTFARHDRSCLTASYYNTDQADYSSSNRNKAIELLTSPSLFVAGEALSNDNDFIFGSEYNVGSYPYINRAPKIYIQQVSPLSRGSAKINFNGNSLLGGNIASFNLEKFVKNPVYSGYTSSSLPAKFVDQISSSSFNFEAVSIYSTVDSRPSPYLILPGDKLTISMSKTRPVIYRAVNTGFGQLPYLQTGRYETYILTGSHGTVMLNTGSINITVYGSYIKEGMEYHP